MVSSHNDIFHYATDYSAKKKKWSSWIYNLHNNSMKGTVLNGVYGIYRKYWD